MAKVALVALAKGITLQHATIRHIPGTTRVRRFGESGLADEAFFAWTSGDLDRMLAAFDIVTNAVDRHHLLSCLAEKLFDCRSDDPAASSRLVRVVTAHLREFPALLPELQRNSQIDRDCSARLLNERGDLAGATRMQLAPVHWGVFASHRYLFQLFTEMEQWEPLIDVAEIAFDLGVIDAAERDQVVQTAHSGLSNSTRPTRECK